MISLVFDLDDTLYVQGDQFKAAVIKSGLLTDPARLEELYTAFNLSSEATYLLHDQGEITLAEMRSLRIQQAFNALAIQITKAQAKTWQELYQREQSKISLSPLMVDLLEACAEAKVQLGLITNGPSDHQRRKITALNLSRWFKEEQIVVSGDLGISKPDPKIFKYLKAKLPLVTTDYYYIGDNFINDIQGGLNVGWQTIWLNLKGEKQNLPNGVTEVNSQQELTMLIKSLISN